MKFISKIGFILVAVYLILMAINALIPGIVIPVIISRIVALAAAFLILAGRWGHFS
ncbi:TPA: hypothetical protein KLD64_001196 [Legionella pneumophila]|nr:hypothetical protein [Legionella pneumophila]